MGSTDGQNRGMKNSQRLVAAALAVLVLLAAAGYWYWSPFMAVRALQTSAQNGDAEAFNAQVDYPRLRESLKDQFSALVAQKLGASKDSGNPMAALGNLIGAGIVNQLVDAMVRPETVMAAMQSGTLGRKAPEPLSATPQAMPPAIADDGAPSIDATPKKKDTRWIIDRQGASKMTAYAVDPAKPDEPNADRLGLVFERSGLVDWKLTDIRLPASTFK